jgi:hypothetical protein
VQGLQFSHFPAAETQLKVIQEERMNWFAQATGKKTVGGRGAGVPLPSPLALFSYSSPVPGSQQLYSHVLTACDSRRK